MFDDRFSAYDTLFVGKPAIKTLFCNMLMLSGKCRSCFGNGRVYVRGDYERCNSCNSFSGYLTIIININ